MADEEIPKEEPTETDIEEVTWGDRLLVPGKPLTPRHRKLAEFAAQGLKPGEIAKKLGYSNGRISVLLSNTMIKQEIARVQQCIYEDTVAKRLKDIVTPAMDEIETCLKDNTNAYPKSLKVSTAIWAAEMTHGKATQKTELGGSILVSVIDRLDAMKNANKTLESDVQPVLVEATDAEFSEPAPVLSKTDEDLLKDWVIQYKP